ncbi:MAG: chorismate synthase [Deltaproteobacteria bacterium]|nr:chorismate synthase [Deltaproteobacteria bacterium]MBW1927745.1 chorismate synthase [Deltaproteobacteria bacterium]MBW2026894.1 chorismate synthase [Deltaproteobacteria bacterium]MBW2127602.1 chorismate synthase [Deltaproteobacteria bacterium]
MAGNTLGQIFRITTFGESHGPGIGIVIDGCPPRIPLSPQDFTQEMARRRPGQRPSDSPRKEQDHVEILSGVFEGLTTGAPICLYISNRDADSSPYKILGQVFRPGHGDYTYFKKYGHFDFRGGGRYSARETAARVAGGVVAQKILEPQGVSIMGYTMELGGIRAVHMDLRAAKDDPLCCPDRSASKQMQEALDEAKRQGDSLGGIVEVKVVGCPPGLGEPVFDKLDADLAKALFSVGTVKAVEIGAGFGAARLKGSENNDPIDPRGFRTNNAGGILAGISNGDDIILRVAIKPIPSIKKEQDTIDREAKSRKITLSGRHDVSAIPRIIPVLEAMVKIVLADHYLRHEALKRYDSKNTP